MSAQAADPAVVGIRLQVQRVESAISTLGNRLSSASSIGDFGEMLDAIRSCEESLLSSSDLNSARIGDPSSAAVSLGSAAQLALMAYGMGGAPFGPSGAYAGTTGTTGVAGRSPTPLEIQPGTSAGSAPPGGLVPAMEALGMPASMVDVFIEAGQANGLSPVLLAAVAKAESGFDPSALSSAGAEGLMQLMPSTAQSLGVVDPYDPTQAVNGAAQLLSGLIAHFKSVPLALAAYNAGAGAVERYGGIPPYAQTQSYVSEILGYLAQVGDA
ncbi:MAG: lytic transglycosylase domain-containing protein [Actinobacteria bacterium]|nr:lytic transglycosylase domain-containing protein [Actinomycetota bacterium]